MIASSAQSLPIDQLQMVIVMRMSHVHCLKHTEDKVSNVVSITISSSSHHLVQTGKQHCRRAVPILLLADADDVSADSIFQRLLLLQKIGITFSLG